MSSQHGSTIPTRGFWIISAFALVWNLIGIVTYLMSVTMSQEALAAMPEAERALYVDMPTWVISAYAIAVFGGTIASFALLLRKAWSVSVFIVSLIAILFQMGHAFLGTAFIEVQGAAAAILPLLIIVIAVYLIGFSTSAKKKGWIS